MPARPAAITGAAFRELTAGQDGVASRQQLHRLGVTRHHVARRVATGQWRRFGPHVLVLHGGPVAEQQKLWVAVLHGGHGAALGGLTAAIAEGLEGFDCPVLHVLVPHGRNRPDLQHPEVQVRLHESRRLGPEDLHPARMPPRIRLPRAVIDAAAAAGTDLRCRAMLAAAVQQRLLRPAALRQVAVDRLNLPRRGLILETLADVEGGSHSLPELEWLRGLRRAGLPPPTRQAVVRRPDGRCYLDAEFSPYGVAVEINGAQHLELLAREADDLRRARIAIGGRLVVDLSSTTVRRDNDLAVLVTADALLSRGWRPPPRARRRLQEMAARRGGWCWTVRSA